MNGPTGLFVAGFPDGGGLDLVAESAGAEFFTEVQANNDRIAWTLQRKAGAPESISSVRVLCKD